MQIPYKCYRIGTSYLINMKTVSHLVLDIIMLSLKILCNVFLQNHILFEVASTAHLRNTCHAIDFGCPLEPDLKTFYSCGY